MQVEPNHLYILAGRNSAFTHHWVAINAMTPDQLSAVSAECHSKEKWVHLFHSFKAGSDEIHNGAVQEDFIPG